MEKAEVDKKLVNKQITKYLNFLIFIVVAMTTILLVRAADLQGWRGDEFYQKSEENRLFRWEIPAERGVFSDRHGEPLVNNVKQYFKVKPDQLYSEREYITAEEALRLLVESPELIGYELEREYLYPISLAHVLGYVGSVEVEDLEIDRTLGLSDTLGKMGLEKKYDDLLRGVSGFKEFEVDALGRRQNKSVEVASKPGVNIQTSIDIGLTEVAWKALGEKKGAVVILDPETGQVLSLISSPSFNSNLLGQHRLLDNASKQEVKEMFLDEGLRFFNRAISGVYPPGSVFKLVTALAGLESGAFDQNTVVEDNGFIEVGGSRFANWYYTQYGRTEGAISLVRAIARSNDIYFYKAAELAGVDRLASLAERVGFGKVVGIELLGEKSGLVPNPAWKEKALGERWFLGNTFHMGIGQGDLLVTPLQLAQMIGMIVNHGELCTPSLLSENRPDCAGMGLSDANLDLVMEGMLGACSAGGTAYPFFEWNSLVGVGEDVDGGVINTSNPYDRLDAGSVVCKTGTAEFGASDGQGYRKTHAWYGMGVGDLPEGFPEKLVIMVLVESDDLEPFMEGSRDAAPVAKEIFDWIVMGGVGEEEEVVGDVSESSL